MKKIIFSLPCWGRWHGRAVTDEVSSSNENAKTDLIHRKRSPFPNREGSRRGFTIVELVVSLTIIVLVSAVSIGVVSVNNKTHAETIDMIEATNIAENAVECFRVARNDVPGYDADPSQCRCMHIFEDTFKRSLGYKKDQSGNVLEPDDIDLTSSFDNSEGLATTKMTYEVKKDGVTVTIVFTGSVTGETFRFDTITITAHSSTDDNLFEETVTYTVR